jgi:hypothetical protein
MHQLYHYPFWSSSDKKLSGIITQVDSESSTLYYYQLKALTLKTLLTHPLNHMPSNTLDGLARPPANRYSNIFYLCPDDAPLFRISDAICILV